MRLWSTGNTRNSWGYLSNYANMTNRLGTKVTNNGDSVGISAKSQKEYAIEHPPTINYCPSYKPPFTQDFSASHGWLSFGNPSGLENHDLVGNSAIEHPNGLMLIHGAAIYGVPWIPSRNTPLILAYIYTSTMDPSWEINTHDVKQKHLCWFCEKTTSWIVDILYQYFLQVQINIGFLPNHHDLAPGLVDQRQLAKGPEWHSRVALKDVGHWKTVIWSGFEFRLKFWVIQLYSIVQSYMILGLPGMSPGDCIGHSSTAREPRIVSFQWPHKVRKISVFLSPWIHHQLYSIHHYTPLVFAGNSHITVVLLKIS